MSFTTDYSRSPPEIIKILLFSRGGVHPVECNRHFENSRLNEC